MRRFGGLTKWTNESQADDIRGSLSKTLLTSSVDSIKPTYETVLNAFGGYVPNYAAVNMGSVQIQSGTFIDTGVNGDMLILTEAKFQINKLF